MDIGLLSGNSKGNYMLQGRGMSLNPSMSYFTREKDVKNYKKAFFSDAQYKVNIFQGV